jgi:hypothetical protein
MPWRRLVKGPTCFCTIAFVKLRSNKSHFVTMGEKTTTERGNLRIIFMGPGRIMRVSKQVLRKQLGVVLLETKTCGYEPDAPARLSYSISSKRTPKICFFDDLQVAECFFEDEASYCRRTLHSQDRRYAQMIEVGPNSYQEERA